MSRQKHSSELENIVRDEYEIELYGFAIDEFLEENFLFVQQKTRQTMNEISKIFIKQLKPEEQNRKDNIAIIGESTADDIMKSVPDDVKKVNEAVERHLRIPENVLIHSDRAHLKKVAVSDQKTLEKECEDLEDIVKENAFFIQELLSELRQYEQIADVANMETVLINKVEEHLSAVLESDLMLQNAIKLTDLL